MELEDFCDNHDITYYTFDAGEPVWAVEDEVELTQEEITRQLDSGWLSPPHLTVPSHQF